MRSKDIPLHKKLSSHFLVITLLISLVPLTIVYVFSTNSASDMLVESLRNDLKEKAFLVGADIDRYFQQREHDVRILSQADVLEGDSIERIIQYLTEVIEETPYLNDIDIIDKNGFVIASSGEQNERGKSAKELYPELVSLISATNNGRQGQMFVSEVIELDYGPGLAFLTPITDDSNTQVIKILLVEINLDAIKKIVADFDSRVIGEKYVYLVDNDGKVIVTADPNVSLLSFFPDLVVQPDLLQSFSNQGEVGSVIYEDAKKDLVMAGFADMAEFGVNLAMDWSIIAVAPMADITHPVEIFSRRLFGFTMFAFIVASFLMFVTSRNILNSVKKLVDGALRVGEGDIHFRVEQVSNNEFTLLGNTINHTLDRLVSARQKSDRANKELTILNLELKDTQGQLIRSQKLESLGVMAGGLAHEFNNALAVILGNAELLLGNSPDSSHKKIKRILQVTDNASKLVDQILSFSRIDIEEFKPINLADTVQESVEMIRSIIPANIEIRQNITGECFNILGDVTQIHQVVVNLCTNAHHAMEKNGGILQLSLKKTSESLQLKISDTGCGITQEDQSRIFDPFFTTKEVGKGTGLGLSVIYRILQNHQGNITVESDLGIGTAFTITLPMTTEAIPEEPAYINPKGGTGRILVVEDEADIAQLYQECLAGEGYETIVVDNGLAALNMFKEQPDGFDLVLTDQSMPKMKGEVLAKELLSIRPDLPIILASGYVDMPSDNQVQGKGIRQYLHKPVRLGLLTQAIASCLTKEISANVTQLDEFTK